jgi:hypothetical protein
MPQVNYIPPPPGPPLPDNSEGFQVGSSASELGGESNANTLAAEYLAAGSNIRCALLHVKYGKCKFKAAGLIVFEANFDFPAEDSRTKRATIEVSFSSGVPEKPAPLPIFFHHSPSLVRSATVDSTLTVHRPSPGDDLVFKLGGSEEEFFTYLASIIPHSHTRKGRQCINTVSWRISENEAQQGGVHPIFRGAIIVQLPIDIDRPFYAQFKLHSTQACEVRLLCQSFVQEFGGDKDGPVRFDSRVDLQADGLSDNLEDIDLNQLLA